MAKKKVIWSSKAKLKLFNILEYYAEKNKSKTYSNKLYKKLTKTINLLHKHPDLGRKTNIDTVRGVIVGDYIIFYENLPESIIIHTLWDCRHNPNILEIK